MNTLMESSANLFRGIEGVGGKLTLTSEALIFTPHSLNVQRQIETIPLGSIDSIEGAKTLGIVPNGLKVVTADREFRFVVRRQRQWIEAVNTELQCIR